MRILHIAATDKGGAAMSCIRLHGALRSVGVESRVLVLKQAFPEGEGVHYFREDFLPNRFRNFWNRLLREAQRRREDALLAGRSPRWEHFSFPTSAFDIRRDKNYRWADVINLHWTAGFLDCPSFFPPTKPAVWTLHDMNAFTGGCHYTAGCPQFETACTACPQLEGSALGPAGIAGLFGTKLQSLRDAAFHVVTPSRWLGDEAKASKLLGGMAHSVIPYSLDVDVFRVQDKEDCRRALGLPLDKRLLLFVAQDTRNPRKGLHLLLEAIEGLDEDTHIVTVGQTADIPGGVHAWQLGTITDARRLASVYAAADWFIIPSLEDNLPNTALEAVSCGTGVLSFRIGGLTDIVREGGNGWFAADVSAEALRALVKGAGALAWSSAVIREDALRRYSPSVQAGAYVNLYRSILAAQSQP